MDKEEAGEKNQTDKKWVVKRGIKRPTLFFINKALQKAVFEMFKIVCIRNDFIFNPLIWAYIMRAMEILSPKLKTFLATLGKTFHKKKAIQEQLLL